MTFEKRTSHMDSKIKVIDTLGKGYQSTCTEIMLPSIEIFSVLHGYTIIRHCMVHAG